MLLRPKTCDENDYVGETNDNDATDYAVETKDYVEIIMVRPQTMMR